jgi:hypothetical protein
MKPECSLACSQKPVTGPYPQRDESSSQPPNVSLRSNLILSSHLCLSLLSGSLQLFHVPKNPSKSEALCNISQHTDFLRQGVVGPLISQLSVIPHAAYSQLPVTSSVRELKTHLAVVRSHSLKVVKLPLKRFVPVLF